MRLILFFLLASSGGIALSEPIPPHPGEWSFTDYADYYRSAANYLSAGTSASGLPLAGSYALFSDSIEAAYDLDANWRFLASIGWAHATAASSTVTYTGQNFTEFDAAAQYWWKHATWALVPTAAFGYPFYRINASTTNNALVSNAAAWIEGGAWGIYYFHPWAIYGYGGYRYQDGGQAGLMNLDIGASYRLATARIRLGFRGETTVINDSDTGQAYQRQAVTTVVDAASEKFYSVNPTCFEGYGEFDYLFMKDLEGGIGFAQSVYGNNSAQGWTLEGMVRFRLPTRGPPDSGEPSSDGPRFQEKVEKYDQDLFEQSNPDQAKPKPQKVKKSGEKNMDQMIRDTEKSLEK